MTVRVRFAPSPTGFLHIGGVRTALFNWLFARHHGGSFILRVDDTDRERNIEEALGPILDGFRWLGIEWDEGPEVGGEYGPYYQSQRSAHYTAAVAALLASGHAYRDYATADELEAERQEDQAAGRRFVYSRRWMAADDEQAAHFAAEGRQGVVRLKVPRRGACRFADRIRGAVEVEWESEQDHVVQRADGTVLYNLASVVDDELMGITHVIRAEEHLSNTPRQIFIAESLGYVVPEFAHLPVVAEPGSGSKLSKRKLAKYLKNPDFARLYEHGLAIAAAIGLETAPETFNPVTVDFYREVGYLPDALVNYLLLLGWSLDDRTEFLSRGEMIERFSLERVGRSSASFDPQKLTAFQAYYMRGLSEDETVAMVLPYLVRAGLVEEPLAPAVDERVRRILRAAGDRIVVAGDILEYQELFVGDGEIDHERAVLEKHFVGSPGASEASAQNIELPTIPLSTELHPPSVRLLPAYHLLADYRSELAAVEPFDAPTLEASLRAFVERRGVKLGQVIHALRFAVTGKSVGFGMFEILEILGRDSTLARIDRALAAARAV